MNVFDLLNRVAAASREVMEAAVGPAATRALDALVLRQRLERLVQKDGKGTQLFSAVTPLSQSHVVARRT